MSGVYIKGMEMPKCGRITIQIGADGAVYLVTKCKITAEKYMECNPAIAVQPHGRLIDADAFKNIVASSEHMDAGIFGGKMLYSDHLCVGADYEDVCKAIDETPTIIPAEDGET